MYFPSGMTFQYFFFDTYVGYFLQALPIALLAAVVWYMVRNRREPNLPRSQKLWSCAFVCYMTGLVCLVILLDLMGSAWYALLYHQHSGRSIAFFGGAFHLVPDFWQNINGEVIGNVLMFLPFGILHPLSHPKDTFWKTVFAGFVSVAAIEVLQPVFGRAFDINDIILNTFGIAVSAGLYFLVKKALCNQRSY